MAKNNQQEPQLSPAMVEDKETEKRKKRDLDAGLIVIADDGTTAKPKELKKGGQQ